MDGIEEDHAGDPKANLDDLLHTETRTTNTGQAAPASLPDLALLTSAIVNLKGAVSYYTHMLLRITNLKALGQRFQV